MARARTALLLLAALTSACSGSADPAPAAEPATETPAEDARDEVDEGEFQPPRGNPIGVLPAIPIAEMPPSVCISARDGELVIPGLTWRGQDLAAANAADVLRVVDEVFSAPFGFAPSVRDASPDVQALAERLDLVVVDCAEPSQECAHETRAERRTPRLGVIVGTPIVRGEGLDAATVRHEVRSVSAQVRECFMPRVRCLGVFQEAHFAELLVDERGVVRVAVKTVESGGLASAEAAAAHPSTGCLAETLMEVPLTAPPGASVVTEVSIRVGWDGETYETASR